MENDKLIIYNLAIQQQKLRIYRNKKRKYQNTPLQKLSVHQIIKNNIQTVKKQPQKYINNTVSIDYPECSKYLQQNKIQSSHLISKQIPQYNSKSFRKPRFSMFLPPYLMQKKSQSKTEGLDRIINDSKQKSSKIRKKIISATANRGIYHPIINLEGQKNIIQEVENQIIELQKKYKQPKIKEKHYSTDTIKKKYEIPYKQSNIENIINRKPGLKDFSQYILQFTQRLKYSSQTKLFIFRSNDEFIRRILLQNQWIQNTLPNSNFFHLKWVSSDKIQHYKFYEGYQFYNHFKDNFKITTKIGLHKNLLMDQMKPYYYPHTFDPTVQYDKFLEQFQRGAIFSILKKQIDYINERYKQQLNINKDQYNTDNLKQILQKELFYSDQSIEQFKINMPMAIQLCIYLENLKNKLENRQTVEILKKQTIEKLMNYSKYHITYQMYNMHRKSSILQPKQTNLNTAHKIKFNDDYNKYFCKNSFFTPSKIIISKLKSYQQYFSNLFPHYQLQGDRNIWILKTCNSSKGIGICLEDHLQSINKKKQNRIIQKYIQNCLIFNNIKNHEMDYLNGRKFDIRQWVLVKSFNPFQIYIYEQFYIRICSQLYDLSDIKTLSRHLTNYSQNKLYFNNQQQSVIHSTNFIKLLQQIYQINYKLQIQFKIRKIIFETLIRYKDKIPPNQSCFQLYGFDFLISSKLIPYLLQINLSPACQQRTQWLTKMVQQMGKGLLKIVLPEEYSKGIQDYRDKWIRLDQKGFSQQ